MDRVPNALVWIVRSTVTATLFAVVPASVSAQQPTIRRLALEGRADEARFQAWDPLRPVEILAQSPEAPAWANDSTLTPASPIGGSRIRFQPRGTMEGTAEVFLRNGEAVLIVNTPMQISIMEQDGVTEISADRFVVWTDKNVGGLAGVGLNNAPVEFYLEGNIEFRQGRQVVFAERMYYDVQRQNGLILEAELYADVAGERDEYPTPFRVKTDVLQQTSPSSFQAENAAFTTSRLGIPQYWIQSDRLTFDTGSTPLFDQIARQSNGPGDFSQFDRLFISSDNTRLFVAGIPVLRWPRLSTDLAQSRSLFLDRIRFGSDSVFGTQVLTRWNNFQLLGITPPEGTQWTTTLDYLSDRGIGFGTDLEHKSDSFFGIPSIGNGFFRSWFINDKGTDNLGFDRRSVPLEENFRGRMRLQDRRLFRNGMQLTSELGWISDRNFSEQYYEQEWDREKDQDTRIQLKQFNGSGTWSLTGGLRLNDFFTQTEWLPRFDHYEIGRSFFQNRFTWFEHTQVGYGRLKTAEAPTNLVDAAKFDPLAWEQPASGMRLATRQEIDMPMQWGAFKVVPYVLGEAAYWQEDLNQQEVTRLLGQGGLRTSVPFWRVIPDLQNELFNLNGLAHKVVLESDFVWADASENYTRLPLYDPLNDDAIEFAQRRHLFDTFGRTFGENVPFRYDERNFAFRSGIQRNVTSPTTEIADDLMMWNLALRNRWQTRRGNRIVDVFVLDIETSLFPRNDRDNFGETIGPTTYDLRWHLGDRTTIFSDGYLDWFDQGLRTVSIGAAITRPGRSQYSTSIRSIEGPISSAVLTTTTSTLLSPKWILNYASSIDFGSTGNIGQSGSIVRVGESVLFSVGAHYDASRNNFGFRFDIAPRIFRSTLGRIGGRSRPPVGASGLE